MSKVDRLYESFRPAHYELAIEPNFEKLNFKGSVTITGKLTRAASSLKLHANSVKVSKAVVDTAKQSFTLKKIIADTKKGELALSFGKRLPAGQISLKLNFSGTVKDNLHGLYAAHFKSGNKQKTLLVTQFEANHAREVFPCIDEPEAKATFNLALKVPKKLTTLSNMPIKTELMNGPLKQVSFDTTPVMSPYLLAFIIGEVSYIEAKTNTGTLIRAYSTPANTQYLQFALSNTVKILEFYNDYFKLPYPLPKLDVVALPDFAAGAMENWGLVTFREELLLLDPKNSSLATKEFIVLVIAHELAHQWFGNLVTMRWWNDLWLNEGFASWIEYLATDHLYPQWKMWTQFVSEDYSTALAADGLANTHPIEVPINDPAEIQQVFDVISYQKGASVIRMLHEFLGKADFRSGLRAYLKQYRYSNATTKQLWQALETASGKPAVAFMSTWTKQAGFPQVSYRVKGAKLHFTQRRFLLSPLEQVKQKSSLTWPVPIALANSKTTLLLDKATGQLPLPKQKSLKFNPGESGFYRLQYPTQALQALIEPIRARALPTEDRLGLLSDAFALTKAGSYNITTFLDFLTAYDHEADYPVWEIMVDSLGQMLRVFETKEFEAALQPFGRQLAGAQLQRLGWQTKARDSHFDQLLRPLILGLASRMNDKSTIAKAQSLFANHTKPTHPDLRAVIYSTVGRVGGPAEYEQMFKLYQKATLAEEKNRLAAGLCSFRSPELIQRSIAMIRSPQVRLQEAPSWMARLLFNKEAKYLLLEWLQTNWQWFIERFGAAYHASRIINYVGSAFSSHDTAAELERFFKAHKHPGIERSVLQALESIRLQAEWKQRDYQTALDFLKKNS